MGDSVLSESVGLMARASWVGARPANNVGFLLFASRQICRYPVGSQSIGYDLRRCHKGPRGIIWGHLHLASWPEMLGDFGPGRRQVETREISDDRLGKGAA